ncbi:dTDP-4-dehydrorhamnose 3,5-epimerase [Thermopetrobacter sp. TC1]|uniref:dTDP-4-dehydrorhamnose 3,5-epimerase n=1 Tax=Thermopetrobacter sp. TC1 TaxID=1495045 RepID=UPI00056EB00E|nr:dTDP-4-dehydrorhamnose 3,5-epimerase [Thermopetrobacter sp. TC1]
MIKIIENNHVNYDERGYFLEVYNKKVLSSLGINVDFAQDNQSFSWKAGTIRGLHFQIPPHAQAKLVRVLRGRILDVAVDIRKGSPTFGQYVAVELSAENRKQLFIPEGFAHGFCTLEDETEVFYKVSDYYAPECERGLLFDDPALAIPWPVSRENAIINARDLAFPTLAELPDYFVYSGRDGKED